MKLTNIFLALVFMLFASSNSFAKGGSGGSEWVFLPALSYSSSTTNDTEANVKIINNQTRSTTFLMAKLGYEFSNGIFVGAIYDSESFNDSLVTTNNASRTSYGGSVGFMKNGFNIIASYLASSTLTLNTSPANKWTGTGLNVDVGYNFEFGNWGFGPLFSYRTFNYTAYAVGSTNLQSSTRTESNIQPYLQFVVMF